MNRDKFYVDEEPLDPRLSVSRIVSHFKKAGIESVSFYKGVEKKDLRLFLEIASQLNVYPDTESMNKAMFKKRVNRIKINHVFYKKVSAEWIKSHSAAPEHEFNRQLTVLEALEQGVSVDGDLGEILRNIRKMVESQEIDENDFDQIYPEIVKQDQLRKKENEQKGLSTGIMRDQLLMTYIDKEIARAKRYETHPSALGLECDRMSVAQAVDILDKGAGSHFDVEVVAALKQCLTHDELPG